MKLRELTLAAMLPLTLILLSVRAMEAQGGPDRSKQILSSRPLDDAADFLRHLYGKVVTYEDPIWVWPGELEPLIKNSGRTRLLLTPHKSGFVMMGDAASEPSLSAALEKALSAYHQQTNGPRFRVLNSKLGLHIVPTQVRDASGAMVTAKNPLDANISVSVEERLPSGHMRAVVSAIAATTGIQLDFVTAVMMRQQLRGDPFDQLFAADPARFRWGVSQVTARDAVIDLLDMSATTFAWTLQYVPGTQAQDNKAYFSLVPIEVTVTGPDGRPINKGVFYDRCGKCPPLLPVPAPPLDRR